MPSALSFLFPSLSPPVEFMQNLNTKGKDVLAATIHTTLKVIFIAVYICKYKKKWLCIFEFSKLSEALYHSYSKESLVVVFFFFYDVIPFVGVH